MSAAQTIHLIDKLSEAKIPKETATELLEYVEQKQTNLATKDYFEARIAALEDKIIAIAEKLESKVLGLRLFSAFHTTLVLAVLTKLFLD